MLGANCFTAEQYTKLVELLKDAMEMTFSRASERLQKRQDEDYDEQVEEELEEEVCAMRERGGGEGRGMEEGRNNFVFYWCPLQGETDQQYLGKVADVMHSLFQTHGATLLPLFDELLPTFASMVVRCTCSDLASHVLYILKLGHPVL